MSIIKSRISLEDVVTYRINGNTTSIYYRCIVDGKYAEFTENQIQVAIERANKHQDYQRVSNQNSTSRFGLFNWLSKLFKN